MYQNNLMIGTGIRKQRLRRRYPMSLRNPGTDRCNLLKLKASNYILPSVPYIAGTRGEPDTCRAVFSWRAVLSTGKDGAARQASFQAHFEVI